MYQNFLVNTIFNVHKNWFHLRGACGINMKEYIVFTGGYMDKGNTHVKTVSMYDMNGWVENLPDLNTARSSHGCGFYYSDKDELVKFSFYHCVD